MKKVLAMIIDDVFLVTGRGTIVTGQLLCDEVSINDSIIIDPEFLPEFQSEISKIEAFRKFLKTASKGDYIGIQLKEVQKKQVKKGIKIYKLINDNI